MDNHNNGKKEATNKSSSSFTSSWEDQESALFGPDYKRSINDQKTITKAKTVAVAKRVQEGVTYLMKNIENSTHSTTTNKYNPFQSKSCNNNNIKKPTVTRNTCRNTVNTQIDNNTTTNTTNRTQNHTTGNNGIDGKKKKNMFANITTSYLVPFSKQNGICCVICQKLLIVGMYQFHPFFPNERACTSHLNPRKCHSCHRFLPSNPSDTTLCRPCQCLGGGIISSSVDAQPVWNDVCDFFQQCQLFSSSLFQISRDTLQLIPVLIVHPDGLQDPSIRGTRHDGTGTRGLCMYTYTPGGAFQQWLQQQQQPSNNDQQSSSRKWNSSIFFQKVTKTILKVTPSTRIRAILCLENLPRILATSILVHEATHAWFKSQHIITSLPLQIEEGCCQLMAYLWLQRQLKYNINHEEDKERNQLLQYYMYSIETDPSEIYGTGYRKVAASYAKMASSNDTNNQDISHFLHYIIHNLKLPDTA